MFKEIADYLEAHPEASNTHPQGFGRKEEVTVSPTGLKVVLLQLVTDKQG